MKTKERIISKSLELFNKYGVDSVPIHRIAAELNISPGNLTYHYKSKDDIIRAIYPNVVKSLEDAMDQSDGVERPLSVKFVSRFQIGIARALWQNRFFFISLKSILARDSDLEREYWVFHERVISRLQKLLDDEIESHGMRSVPSPNTTAIIAANQWYVWVSFLFFQGHESKVKKLEEHELIYNGVLRNFSLLLPYCTERFALEFADACKEELDIEAAKMMTPDFHALGAI